MAIASTDIGIRVKANVEQARMALRRLQRAVHRNAVSVDKLGTKFKGLDRFWSLMVLGSMAAVITSFVRMAAELQKTQFQIAAFVGGFEKVPEVMDRIFNLARRVPFDIDSITKTFVRLKASGIEPIIDAQGNGPLKNLMDGVAAFGGGPEIFQRAGIALQQMAGKGVISMEELRQQLGEAIPVAMRVMAKEMGISVASMITTISKGNLTAEEGISALSEGLRKSFGGLSDIITNASFLGQLTQIKNKFQTFAKTLIESGGLDILTAGLIQVNEELQKLNDNFDKNAAQINEKFLKGLEDIAPTLDVLTTVFGSFIRMVGDLIVVFATLIGSTPPELASGGFLGWFIAGKLGLNKTYGAMLGAFLAVFDKLGPSVTGFVKGVVASVPDVIKEFGFIAWFFGGKFGKIFVIGTLIGSIFGNLLTAIEAFINEVESTVLNGVFKGEGFWGWLLNDRGGVDKAFDGFAARFDRRFADLKVTLEKRKKQLEEGTFIGFKDDPLKASVSIKGMFGGKDAIAQAKEQGKKVSEGYIAGAVDKLRDGVKFVQSEKAKIDIPPIEDIGGFRTTDEKIFSKNALFLERLRVRIDGVGSQIRKARAIAELEVNKLNGIIDNIKTDISAAAEQGKEFRIPGLKDTMKQVEAAKKSTRGLTEALINELTGRALPRLTQQLERTSEALDTMSTRSGFVDRGVEKIENRFAGLALRLAQIKQAIIDNVEKGPQQNAILARLAQILERLENTKADAVIDEIKKRLARMAKEAEKAAKSMQKLETALKALQADINNDAVGAAGIAAQGQIDARIDQINAKITEFKEKMGKGLIQDEATKQDIIRLEAIRDKVTELGKEFVQRAEDNASSFGQFTQKVGKSVEDALADSFENLVTRSKSAKDIILDLYAAITKAAARYLAQEAMMAMFGGPGASGPGAGSAGFAQALQGFSKMIGFQHGGQFIVGGAGGPDSQVVAFRASPGETITAEPPGASRGGGGDTYNINAIDSRSIQQMLMENGDAISASLSGHRALNRK